MLARQLGDAGGSRRRIHAAQCGHRVLICSLEQMCSMAAWYSTEPGLTEGGHYLTFSVMFKNSLTWNLRCVPLTEASKLC